MKITPIGAAGGEVTGSRYSVQTKDARILSPGRRLVDGATEVKIFGETIAVKTKIQTLGGFSAHAGQTDLLHWFNVIAPGKPRVILTHGEDGQRAVLAKMIQQKFRLPSQSPAMGEVIEL